MTENTDTENTRQAASVTEQVADPPAAFDDFDGGNPHHGDPVPRVGPSVFGDMHDATHPGRRITTRSSAYGSGSSSGGHSHRGMISTDSAPRDYVVLVHDFDFNEVHVQARSRGHARYLCARAFRDAGFGSIGEGLRHVYGCRLASLRPSFRLISAGSEGLLYDDGGAEWSRP